ncbi:MAG: adenylate/guanylate cyclase domain-containing protein [Burkholderiaceae bacterium]
MVVDVVESVRLMQSFEADVIDRWRSFVADARGRLLPQFGGRMVKSLGDGMLVEFERAAPAVAAARAMQAGVARYNLQRPDAAAIQLRAGVHVAEVVSDELDVYGAGVNLAARLASCARPGDCVVSLDVRDEVGTDPAWDFEDLGDLFVKHVDQPVRAFRVAEHGATAAAFPVAAGATGRPLKPTLAVIPFSPVGGGSDEQVVGHAIADDLISALSPTSAVALISRLSCAPFANGGWSAAAIRSRLGVAYVLSGSYRLQGTRLHVRAELCDARDEQVVWAGSFSSELDAFFNSDSAMVPDMASQVANAVTMTETIRSASLPIPNLDGYTLYLGGVTRLHRLAPADFQQSRELFQHLVDRQPRAAAPHAMLAKWHILRLIQGWSPDPEQEARLARSAARRAMDLDPDEAFSLSADGMVSVLVENNLDEGERLYGRALAANPHEPYAWALLAGLHAYRDQHDAAIHAARQALALSPLDPTRYLFEAYASMAHLMAGQLEQGIALARSSLRLNAFHTASHRLLAIGLVLAGRPDEARVAAEALMRLEPGFRVARYAAWFPGRHAALGSGFADALRAAGIPD